MDTTLALSILIALSALTMLAVIPLLVIVLRRQRESSSEVGTAISESWLRLGLDQTIGKIELQAKEIRECHTTLAQMLRTPSGRASFGLSLEVILADQLPPDSFGVRQKCFDEKVPDGHIQASEGLTCIDSKFPSSSIERLEKEVEEYEAKTSRA